MNDHPLIRKIGVTLLVVAALGIAGCGGNDKDKSSQTTEKIITTKMTTPVTPLYFTGVLNPIRTSAVTSEIQGTVKVLKFNYGQEVKKDQELIALSSTQLADTFRKAVQDYLQKKDAYTNGKESFQGSKALYEAKINSREQFLSDQTQYENTVLSFFQSEFQLKKVLEKANISFDQIEKLKLGDVDEVNKLLQKTFDNVVIKSPASGVALFPVNTSSSSSTDSKSGKLIIGSQVKQGQLLLSIGDLSGMSVKVEVSEIDINNIKKGMKATVTGNAFPQYKLNGIVTQVASQANPSSSGSGSTSLSMFNVLVDVPKLTAAQQKIIHVGMTAKVQINIKGTPTIIVPIKAVKEKNGQSFVTVVDSNGQKKQVNVQTGGTTPTGVKITSGLKAGDKVVVPN